MRLRFILLFVFILFLILFLSFFKFYMHQINKPQLNEQKNNIKLDEQKNKKEISISNIPKIVHNNFIELDKIKKISKFRSGVGHDFSKGTNETKTCRSMKHYFEPKGLDEDFWKKFHNNNFSKKDFPIVKYFAPVSGTIIDVRDSKNFFGKKEVQFILKSSEYPEISFDFFHVIPQKNIYIGSKINSSDFLGTISPGNYGEIAVSIGIGKDEQLISFFKLIDDKVLKEYKERGLNSINDLIISKEYRDKHPLKCDEDMPHRFIGGWFTSNKEEYDKWSEGKDNWVVLN